MITLGENFAFGFADSGRPHLGQGWSIEPHWSWSTGEAADLALPLPPGEGDLHLELDLTPCVHPPSVPTQRVRILTAGALALERRLAGAAKLHLRVPDPVLPGLVGALPIRFEHPDSVVPREIGLSSDPRRLGICLTRARLLRVPSEPPRLPGPTRWNRISPSASPATATSCSAKAGARRSTAMSGRSARTARSTSRAPRRAPITR